MFGKNRSKIRFFRTSSVGKLIFGHSTIETAYVFLTSGSFCCDQKITRVRPTGSPRAFLVPQKDPSVKKTGRFYGLAPKLLFIFSLNLFFLFYFRRAPTEFQFFLILSPTRNFMLFALTLFLLFVDQYSDALF